MQPVIDLAPSILFFYRPPLPIVGPLLTPTYPATDGPGCPAASATESEQATAAASADVMSGRWSIDLSATARHNGATAASGPFLRADFESPRVGDLFISFDEVHHQFEASCGGCESVPQAGYIVWISAESSAGRVAIGCGNGTHTASDASYTLPDARCGLAEDGGPARLPVGPGPVHLEILIDGFAAASGNGPSAPAVDGRALVAASARIARFDIVPNGTETPTLSGHQATSSSEPDGFAQAVQPTAPESAQPLDGTAAHISLGPTVASPELPRTGTDLRWLLALAGALLMCSCVSSVASRVTRDRDGRRLRA